MAVIPSYKICDICGKKLLSSVKRWSYHIETPNKKIKIWKLHNPYCECLGNPLDICDECWEEMITEIRERVNKNG